MSEKDEGMEFIKNAFGKCGGLKFVCSVPSVSKRCKNKLKKEISNQMLKKRINNDEFLDERSKRFFQGDLFIEFTFSLNKNRYKKNDIDNLIKHSLDCLNGVLFKDDSQVKKVCATKYFVNSTKNEMTGIRIMKIIE